MRGLTFLFVSVIIFFRKWVIFQKLFSIKLYYFPMFGSNLFCCCWETRLGTISDFIHKTQWTSNKTKWAISLGRSSNHTCSLVQHLAFFVKAPATILFGSNIKWVEIQFSNSPYLGCCEIELFSKKNKWIIISKIKPLFMLTKDNFLLTNFLYAIKYWKIHRKLFLHKIFSSKQTIEKMYFSSSLYLSKELKKLIGGEGR